MSKPSVCECGISRLQAQLAAMQTDRNTYVSALYGPLANKINPNLDSSKDRIKIAR